MKALHYMEQTTRVEKKSFAFSWTNRLNRLFFKLLSSKSTTCFFSREVVLLLLFFLELHPKKKGRISLVVL
jgi:hypothetical protein